MMIPENYKVLEWFDHKQCGELIERVQSDHPYLEVDFILQAFCQHWERMDKYFPGFTVSPDCVLKRAVSAEWLMSEVRYDDGEDMSNYWSSHIKDGGGGSVLDHCLKYGTWPFPPIIVSADLATVKYGCTISLGRPFHLFEGTHRYSYICTLASMGKVPLDRKHDIYILN